MTRYFDQLFRSYHPLEILVELSVIWICVYLLFRFLRGTRGGTVFKGALVLIVALAVTIVVLDQTSDALGRLNYIYKRFLALLAVLMVVVFQPELRHAMIKLGRARWFGGSTRTSSAVIESVSDAVEFLSKSQFGALIAIEKETQLGTLIGGGETLDSVVSDRLLESIFWPNSPLHDLGVVIRDDRIIAANVQFPLADDSVLSPNFGSRHRAAVGITLESDAVVVVVSEETGDIRIAEDGKLSEAIARESFREVLDQRLNRDDHDEPSEEATTTGVDPDPRHKFGGSENPTPPRTKTSKTSARQPRKESV